MNNWKFYLGAFGMLSLVSCSNDELTSVNRDGDEITFNVITGSHSRAGDIYGSSNLPSMFYLSAAYGESKFIEKDVINKKDNEWVNGSGTRYWPNGEGEVTFFGYNDGSDDGSNFTWDKNKPAVDFTVNSDVTKQVDFIYAKVTGSKGDKVAHAAPVNLVFQHALSQIVFKAKNTNKNLFVQIGGVSVCNLDGGEKRYIFPEGVTSGGNSEQGSWEKSSNQGSVKYEVDLQKLVNVGAEAGANVVDLTGTTTPATAMLLLPQKTTAWDPETKPDPKVEEQIGSYFLVKCLIWNVANGSGTKDENDVCLWGTKKGVTSDDGSTAATYEARDVAIPVEINWEEGKKYVYTFVFGDGNGGWDPEPGEGDDPKPVLVPITFSVDVKTFDPVTEEEIKMDEPETPTTPTTPATN